ncbi:MAG: tetratricopeptide repeat protein, partial [Crocinitomicaceae bacterium]
IGLVLNESGQLEHSIEYYKKSLAIQIKLIGKENPDLAVIHFKIGSILMQTGNYLNAKRSFMRCLKILLISSPENEKNLSTVFGKIGDLYFSLNDFKKAFKFYSKSLQIELKNFKENFIEIASNYFDISECLFNLKKYNAAIDSLNKGFRIHQTGAFPFKIAQCYEALNEKENALDFYIQSAEKRKEDPEVGLEAEATQAAISNAIRLAKELDKVNELPDWMKNNN